jgi:hypothetical protein
MRSLAAASGYEKLRESESHGLRRARIATAKSVSEGYSYVTFVGCVHFEVLPSRVSRRRVGLGFVGVAPVVLVVQCVVVFLTAHGMASKIWGIPPNTPSPSHPPPGSRAEHLPCDLSVYLSLVYLSLLA